MATLQYPANLQSAQTGNADSTNTIERHSEINFRPPILRIVSTIGATPTVTVNIRGSLDGTTFFNIPYSPLAAVSRLNGRPFFITHGDADTRLSVQYAYDLAEAINANGGVFFRSMPGSFMNHARAGQPPQQLEQWRRVATEVEEPRAGGVHPA